MMLTVLIDNQLCSYICNIIKDNFSLDESPLLVSKVSYLLINHNVSFSGIQYASNVINIEDFILHTDDVS